MIPTSEVEQVDRLFDELFETAPIGTAVSAPDGSWRRVNGALALMLGYTCEELASMSLIGLTHPSDREEASEGVRSLLAGERQSWAVDERVRAKDGSYVWAHVTSMLQRGPDGAALRFVSYVVDIRARKAAEAELGASERRYRRLFESAKDGILILDAVTGCIVDANPFMTELTGYAANELVGQRLWEVGAFADIAASKLAFAHLQATEYARHEDLPLRARNGRAVEVEFVSNVYVVDGQKVIQCNVRDITLRKQTERELAMRDRAIAAVSQGIVITDALRADQPITYASPGFTRITGYEAAEVIGRNCRFLQGPGTDPASVATLSEAVRLERACTVELLNVRKDGSTFWNSIALSPVKDAKNRVTNFVGVQTDVTARRTLESQFLQAQKMEAVGRLAGGVAHDFNNLLSVILSYADLIAAELKPEEPLSADVAEIRQAALRAAELTRQLLAFSRQQVLQPRVLSLTPILAGMEKLLARLLGADIEVTILPGAVLGNVNADPGQIEQIVMNLAVNARDAMPDGGKLTIETANVDLDGPYAAVHHGVAAGPYVLLAVSDTGMGMDKPTLARIFEPFFTTKEKGKGTGLGLATVFGIVRQSGGHIFVYSEVGRGSTFKIYLPRVGGAAAEARPSVSVGAEPASTHRSGTILLVEDEEQVRTIARNILRRQGYVVLDAANGGEALLICEQHPGNIDLLLTDVVLPRMSGRQLAERLAPVRTAMRVLYMSGYTDDAILQHGIIDSGVAFLQKPFTPSTLTQKVREVLAAKPSLEA